jgi:predicted nucleic acid-binding protein
MSARCLDSCFLVDLLAADPAAVKKAAELEASGERLSIAAPAATEVLMGAHFRGGVYLRKALELLGGLDLLPADSPVVGDAGELGAELMRRGVRAGAVDLLIAASARVHRKVLLTRDTAFIRVPGLAVETY